MMTSERVRIAGVEYLVELSNTVADHEAAGRPHLAAMLRSEQCSRDLVVRRPNGHRRFYAREIEVRNLVGELLGVGYTAPVRLGF